MKKAAQNILVLDGHPDADESRLCHALAGAYHRGAVAGGKTVRLTRLADLQVPILRSAADFAVPPEGEAILAVRRDIDWAGHLVFVFPLWLGSAPALLRALLEQVSRGGFVAETDTNGWKPHLRGKSARLIVTMGMPAFAYRLLFGAHGVKSIAASILGFAGVAPVALTLIGAIGAKGKPAIAALIARIEALGHGGL